MNSNINAIIPISPVSIPLTEKILSQRSLENTGCTNPVGDEGTTQCVGNNLYSCRNNQWMLQQENSPQCGIPLFSHQVTCYRCQGENIEQRDFELMNCPEGWSKNIPTCENTESTPTIPLDKQKIQQQNINPFIIVGVAAIGILFIILILKKK